MKNLKGGYQLIDLQGNDLSSGFTLEGLHQVITLSNNKPLLVTGIVISGVKKNDVYSKATKSGTSYVIDVYNKNLTIAEDDTVTVVDKLESDFFDLDLSAFTLTTTMSELDQNDLEEAFKGYHNGQAIRIVKLPTFTGISDVSQTTTIASGGIKIGSQDDKITVNGTISTYLNYFYQGGRRYGVFSIAFSSIYPPLKNKGGYAETDLSITYS